MAIERDTVKKATRIIVAFAILAVIVGFAYLKSTNLIYGPRIHISSPQDGVTVDDMEISIVGQVQGVWTVYLNGRKIFTDDAGHFSEELLLFYGYNIIEMRATDRYGRETKKTLTLFLR